MKDLESKIEQLEAIKPEREFVVKTKDEILGGEKKVSFSFYPFLKRAALALPVLLLLAVGVRLYNRNVRYPRLTSVEVVGLETANRDLREIGTDLAEVREGVKKVEDPEEMVALNGKVDTVLAKAEEVVETSKKVVEKDGGSTSEKFETLTALESNTRELEKRTRDLEETRLHRNKEMAKAQIEYLRGRSLNEKQAAFLQEAEVLYNKGKFGRALEKGLRAQNY